MAVLHNVGRQIEKIDQQLITLIEQRVALCQDAVEDDPTALGPEHEGETIGYFQEEAEHRGLDEGDMIRIGKSIIAICKKRAA
ncbi:chorismate mutase [Candidatus Peregrinibacteria bacterium]|nr:chorismate mutase [Candidatus Peregrinibacteria bacterium]